MKNIISSELKTSWKKHGIAEREFYLFHFVLDSKQEPVKELCEIRDMGSLVVQIEDLGASDKVTLYFDDYRDERFGYFWELTEQIKMEKNLTNFEDDINHRFELEFYSKEDDTYFDATVSSKEMVIDLAENLVIFFCQRYKA